MTEPGIHLPHLGRTPTARAERWIAAGRVVLANAGLLAVALDPTEPATLVAPTYVLLAAYAAYSWFAALAAWTARSFGSRTQLASHAADLAVFALCSFLVKGPTSPFFAYFTFAIVAGAMRWQWRGTAWTAALALTMVGLLAAVDPLVRPDAEFEIGRLVIRSFYLVVVAVLLGYLSVYEARNRRDLSLLAGWSPSVPARLEDLLAMHLPHARSVLAAGRVVLAWERTGAGGVEFASCDGSTSSRWHENGAKADRLVAEPLAGEAFFCGNCCAESPVVWRSGPEGPHTWRGQPLDPVFRAKHAICRLLALPVAGEGFSGYLFALETRQLTTDDLSVGTLAAHALAARLEHFYLNERLRQSALADERLRVAADLHDGVLQSLTAAALRIQAAAELVPSRPEAAADTLRSVLRMVADEQRDLRVQIQELKPAGEGADDHSTTLAGSLANLSQRIRDVWGLTVVTRVDPSARHLENGFRRQVYRIVQEGVVNAARHAAARRVTADVSRDGETVRIVVADDGHGFRFEGRLEHEDLQDGNIGPVSLKARVALLGGRLAIESGRHGSRLEVSLPLAAGSTA